MTDELWAQLDGAVVALRSPDGLFYGVSDGVRGEEAGQALTPCSVVDSLRLVFVLRVRFVGSACAFVAHLLLTLMHTPFARLRTAGWLCGLPLRARRKPWCARKLRQSAWSQV
jgi:hypothetical protein